MAEEKKPKENEEKREGKGEREREHKEPGSEKREEKGAKKKKHLHQIITTFAHDGTAGHEHVYKAKKEDHHTEPPVFAGTSSNMEDLHDHMEDHAGPQMNGGSGEEQEQGAESEQGGQEEPEEQ